MKIRVPDPRNVSFHLGTRVLLTHAFLAVAIAGCGGDSSPARDDTSPGMDIAESDAAPLADTTEADTTEADTAEAGDVAADGQADTADASGAAPFPHEALDCGTRASAGGLAPGTELQRHDLDTGAFPDALCNDGTGAVFYFRPFEGAENENRWVIQLQGGGACGSADACAARWCSVDTNFGMTQMTSNLAPAGGIDGDGILGRRPANPLGGFNHVFVRYCSSDSWSGAARDVELTARHPVNGESVDMRLHFLGTRIIDAVIATLKADGVAPLSYTLGGDAVAMPDLDDATHVLLAGASAGGAGTTNNADRVGATLSASNRTCGTPPCQLDYRVLIDSIFTPSREQLDYDDTPFCTDQGICTYEAHGQFVYDSGSDALWQRVHDASCLAHHAPTGDEWRCHDTDHLITNHVTTPMFVRMGQTDQLIAGNHIETRFGYDGEPLDLPTFARLIREALRGLSELTTSAEEADAMTTTPGVFGPTCSKHETISSNQDTYNVTIRVDGNDLTMFDVFRNWFQGNGPSGAVAETPADNVCP